MENKFAVLIPITNQIGFDTWKDSYKTLIISDQLNLEQIMIEVKKVSKDAQIDKIHFSNIIQSK